MQIIILDYNIDGEWKNICRYILICHKSIQIKWLLEIEAVGQ